MDPAFWGDWQTIIPEAVLFVFACIISAGGAFAGENEGGKNGVWAVWMIVGSLVTLAALGMAGEGLAYGQMFLVDSLAIVFKVIILIAVILTAASSLGPVSRMRAHRGEYYGMILFSAVGMMLMVSATELLTLYIAIELSTISLFVLAAFQKSRARSAEAGIKYVILGGASSAVLLYGIALLYGLTGTTDLATMKNAIVTMYMSAEMFPAGITLALIFLVAGFGFKLSLAPFHMWAPDVYEGAPTPITAYLSVASKAAAIGAFLRVMMGGLSGTAEAWIPIVAALAALAMIVGNTTAIVQTNIKRMLAYSSIAQIGYILAGAVAINENGVSSITYYTLTYLFSNMGAFICVIAFTNATGSERIADYSGLARRSPALAALLSVFLLSLAGIPPLGGFLGKYYVFLAAMGAGYLWLVIVGVATSVIALFYYAYVIRVMYFAKEDSGRSFKMHPILTTTLAVSFVGVLILGVYPEPFVNWSIAAARSLLG